MIHEVVKYLFELGQLKRVKRSGWWLTGVRDPESVAEHSYRTAIIAVILAKLEGADAGKAALLALFHDGAETRVNDMHHLGKSYVDWSGVEEQVLEDQVGALPAPLGQTIRSLSAEGRDLNSAEAQIAKDADHLECLFQAREYSREGADVAEWVQTALNSVKTVSARAIAELAVEADPNDWRAS